MAAKNQAAAAYRTKFIPLTQDPDSSTGSGGGSEPNGTTSGGASQLPSLDGYTVVDLDNDFPGRTPSWSMTVGDVGGGGATVY